MYEHIIKFVSSSIPGDTSSEITSPALAGAAKATTEFITKHNAKTNVIKTLYTNQIENSENGTLLHKISFSLPDEFVINNILNIVLFDINYQTIDDKTFHKVNEPLSEIKYIINGI